MKKCTLVGFPIYNLPKTQNLQKFKFSKRSKFSKIEILIKSLNYIWGPANNIAESAIPFARKTTCTNLKAANY